MSETQNLIRELIEYLEAVHLDEQTKYKVVVKDSAGERVELYDREAYLEFVVENLIDDLSNLILEMEEK